MLCYDRQPNRQLRIYLGVISGAIAPLLDTPPWFYRWVFKMPGHEQMKGTILGFCGIKVVKISEFAIVKKSSPDQRQKWLAIAKKLGEACA